MTSRPAGSMVVLMAIQSTFGPGRIMIATRLSLWYAARSPKRDSWEGAVPALADVTRAVILAATPDSLTIVGGLPLAVRAVLTLDRAGVEAIGMVAGPQEPALRAALGRRALADRVQWLAGTDDAPALGDGEPVLVVTGDVLFDMAALAPLAVRALESGRIVRGAVPGSGLRVVVCPGAVLPALLVELDGGQRSLAEALPRAGQLDAPAVPVGPGLFVPLDAAHPAPVLERALGDDLARRTAAKDSYLAALIDRRLSRPVTRRLLRWPVTPAQVTFASIALGILGAAGLATVSYWGRLAGVLALIASVVLDCVDGEIARARFEQSAAGARLDVVGDYVVHLAVFSGLGVGLWREGLPPGGGWAAVALVAAVLATTLLLHRLFVGPALGKGGDLHWSGDGSGFRESPVAVVVEKLASRDYTYLLLVLALLGRLEWFLYAAAVGAWVFVGAVLAYWAYQRRALARSPLTS
jgi:phosphatidylglycerophosphate synthase